jgi:hypothetical protein
MKHKTCATKEAKKQPDKIKQSEFFRRSSGE